ncbi:MAG: DUF4129 domain-containing protein [Micromonosporaceae bacterium]|nr:DUF4129 domain-containing protein [Micromonosporaceae bacterium]
MDGLTRAWNEWIATIADGIYGGVVTLFLLTVLAALVIGVLWAFLPSWLESRSGQGGSSRSRARSGQRREGPDRRGRLRLRWRLRWRRRRRSAAPTVETERLPDDQVPDLPADVLGLSADELAAAGRYAEAVRERLRAMLRSLIERGLLPTSPGWTVMELVRAAGRARPALAEPLDAAATIFSEIWYGLRPATADDDAAMRRHAAAVAAVVATEPIPAEASA